MVLFLGLGSRGMSWLQILPRKEGCLTGYLQVDVRATAGTAEDLGFQSAGFSNPSLVK